MFIWNIKWILQPQGVDQYQLVRQFALSADMFERKSLADRFSTFMEREYKSLHPLIFGIHSSLSVWLVLMLTQQDMIAFEKVILRATEPDNQIEQLATPIDEFGDTDWGVL